MMRIKSLTLTLALTLTLSLRAQTADSLRLGYADFLGLVLENHPLAKQAALRGETGAQYLRVARGAFDPYLEGGYDAKQYADKDYWRVFEGSLRLPTWLGVEGVASIATAEGDYLDPSQYLPQGGQVALGLEWNLGRLLMDQRRADLRKAQAYAQGTRIEQRLLLLDLVQDATAAYWDWWLAIANRDTYTEALRLAQVRFDAVHASYLRGENPAIDTLEAYLQVQNRILNLSEADVECVKAGRMLSNFLWSPDGQPAELTEQVRPQAHDRIDARALPVAGEAAWDSLLLHHPDIVQYQLKAEQLAVEERLRREQLKPDLVVKYQALSAPTPGSDIGYLAPAANMKWGVKLSMPLFVRKQRGYLQLNRIAQQEVGLQLDQKALELRNKLVALGQQLGATTSQVELYKVMVENYLKLVDAESSRFTLGESSIFLVNSREQKLIEAELKLNELKAKVPRLLAEANRASGGYLIGER